MKENQTANTLRIAHNTLLLYFRMAIIMLVSLYTSRAVLNVLGIEDYGIYNVVSGIVVLFSFLNTAMTNASQRYLSIAIGKDDRGELIKVFSSSLYLHISLIIIIIALAETIGLWYVKEKLSVPEGKESIAVLTYHLAVIVTCINIFRVPFQATVISYEHMSVYALISIGEAILKLAAIVVIPYISGEKLVLYSLLTIIAYGLILIIFIVFCLLKYKLKVVLISDMKLIKEFISFSGWNILGGIGDITYQQGTSLVINSFCGVTVNAAVGVMNQVRSAVYSFVGNLQLAANPQIIKTYSRSEFRDFYSLISLTSRLSFFLMLVFTVPMLLNIDYILQVWLKVVPMYSSEFCKLILIYCLIDSLSGPLWISIQASGRIKYYQICVSICLLMNLPLSYFALYKGFSPSSVYIIQIAICLFAQIVRIGFAHKYVNLDLLFYFREIILRILVVTILSSILPIIISQYFDGFLKLLLTFTTNLLALCVVVYLFGINRVEREKLNLYIKRR